MEIYIRPSSKIELSYAERNAIWRDRPGEGSL